MKKLLVILLLSTLCFGQGPSSNTGRLPPYPVTPNGVPENCTSVPSGGIGQNCVWNLPGVPTNAQTGTSYTISVTDRSGYVSFSNASSIAVTLPQSGTAGFGNNFVFVACNIGSGAVTITPTTSTISYSTGVGYTSGSSTLVLTTGQCAYIYSDNTNYFSIALGISSSACDATSTGCFMVYDAMCGGNTSSSTIGAQGWSLNATGGTVTKVSLTTPLCGYQGVPGVTSANNVFFSLGAGVGVTGAQGTLVGSHARQTFTFTKSTNTSKFRCGWNDPTSLVNTIPNYWYGIEFINGTNTNWQFVANSAGTDNFTDTTIAEDDGVLHSIQLDTTSSGVVTFTLYGATGNVLKTTSISANIPSGNVIWACGVDNTQTAGGVPTVQIGRFSYYTSGLSLP